MTVLKESIIIFFIHILCKCAQELLPNITLDVTYHSKQFFK